MVLPSADDVWFGGLILAACIFLICIIVVISELRSCRSDWAEDAERKRRIKLNGISDPVTIELIGSRPDSERPAGVDWSISLWAEERGEHCKADRGYGKPLVNEATWSMRKNKD